MPRTKQTLSDEQPVISRRRLKKLAGNAEASAAAASLHYVSNDTPGISRIRKGNEFVYESAGKPVTDEAVLKRIRALVLPPAWEKVWICKDASGHLQATGIDAAGRKQYRYHPAWSSLRSQTKFVHLHEFGLALPAIRACLAHDLAQPALPKEKVLATLVAIMQQTGIRIGSNEYERTYGSFGLSTLKDRHVSITGTEVKFSFRGKKGVEQQLSLKSRKLAGIVKKCRDIPGKELFQYIDSDGRHFPVDSGSVNAYIREVSGGHFTAKDFRTWTGSLTALQAFREIGRDASSSAEARRNINSVLDTVSRYLGNTRAVCRKYYVHPAILSLYEDNKLERYLKELDALPEIIGDGLTKEEEVLMKILEKGAA